MFVCLVVVGPFAPSFGKRNRWTAPRVQDYFDARPQPPGLSGAGAFTAALPENLKKVTQAFRLFFSSSSSSLGFLIPLISSRKDEDEEEDEDDEAKRGVLLSRS